MSGELIGTCIAVFVLGYGYGRLWVRLRAIERRLERWERLGLVVASRQRP